eukprot:m.56461 g.56461  ORF g.56461 m.56461 type:complete len:340 (+) comp11039_c0_seq4:1396-2415(+)
MFLGGFSSRSARTLHSYGGSNPNALEQHLMAWPIPKGLAKSISRRRYTVALEVSEEAELVCEPNTKDYVSKELGLRLHALETGVLFVTDVLPESPAAQIGMVRAMKISCVSILDTAGNDMTTTEMLAVLRHVNRDTILHMELSYDPQTYRELDDGVELRRISLYAFQGKWCGRVAEIKDIQYCGSQDLPASIIQGSGDDLLSAVQKISSSKQPKQKGRKGRESANTTSAILSTAALAVMYTDTKSGETIRLPLLLLDMFLIRAIKNTVCVCVSAFQKASDGNSMSVYKCFVFAMESEEHAQKLCKSLEVARVRGFKRVHNAVHGVETPEILDPEHIMLS